MMPRNQFKEESNGGFGGAKHALAPRSSVDLRSNLAHIDTAMGPFDTFEGSNVDVNLISGMYDDDMDQDVFGGHSSAYPMADNDFVEGQSMFNVDPANIWQSGNPGLVDFDASEHFNAHPPTQSKQSEIVSNRRENVRQQFGQITPPEEKQNLGKSRSARADSDMQTSQQEATAKLNRSERARNAANKRHSKSRKAKQESSPDGELGDGDGDGSQSKSTSLQREKNRVAAAKCRAKKKVNSEEMQEVHREGARQHSFLLREMRELRDQKAFLRNKMLQHDPGVCQCHAIHRYNMAQAQQLAFGVGCGVVGGQPMSPSQESMTSAPTPTSSDASNGRSFSISSSVMDPGNIGMRSRHQSFGGSMNFVSPQSTAPDIMSMYSNTAFDPSQPPQFADFLRGSPEGRAGFS